jgi:hypothetical protein
MNGTELQELIEKADNAYYAADYDKAIELYKQALSSGSDNKHVQEQIQKVEFYLSVKAVKPEDLMAEALQLCKRSRSFIAIGDLDGAKKLLQQAIDIAKEAGVDFIDAKVLLENIKDVAKAAEFKKKAYDELDKQQWVKAEADLSLAIDLDPTDHIVQTLLPHLRSLIKAQKLVWQLSSCFGDLMNRSKIDKEIRDILELTNETPILSNLWQTVYEAHHQFFVPVDKGNGNADLPEALPDKEGNSEKKETPVPKIFISYSHVDERHMKRLVSMLRPFEQQNIFKIWHDREIKEGDEWYQDIQNAINSCCMALLLVSIDFLNSRFIREEELRRLLELRKEKGLRVIPIIIRECPWKNIPVLKDMQALPKDGRPVNSFQGANQLDHIWAEIAGRIAETSKEIVNRII